MYCYQLTDWITIRGDGSIPVQAVTQAEADWLDLSQFQDICFWLEVREVGVGGGVVQMNYQTAPTKDESMFTNVVAAFNMVASTSPRTVDKVLLSAATTPLARFLRFKITSTSVLTWDCTFRCWVAVNTPGR